MIKYHITFGFITIICDECRIKDVFRNETAAKKHGWLVGEYYYGDVCPACFSDEYVPWLKV